MSTALLVVGYALAVPGTLAVLRIAWRRWLWAFVGLEVGMACVVAGWALRGQRFGAWPNAGFAVGFASRGSSSAACASGVASPDSAGRSLPPVRHCVR
ncbi:MAG: hypothetical protein ACRDYA_20510 [Egibacteraceae bacterium]